MNTTTASTIRERIILLGKELHDAAAGLRALAAEKLMRERDISDPDDLFVACEELIGTANLFESYDDPLNMRPGELVLGVGCPFPSLEAYIALREEFGDDWVLQAFEAYFDDGGIGCGDRYPGEVVQRARRNLEAFIARDAEAVSRWLARQVRHNAAVAHAATGDVKELAREALTSLYEELALGDAVRVVSAWRCMPESPDDLSDSEAAYKLRAGVADELGVDRSEAGCDDGWPYGTFVELRQTHGEQWPEKALADYLWLFEGADDADDRARKVWNQALAKYEELHAYEAAA
jgi:hypothetical protein